MTGTGTAGNPAPSMTDNIQEGTTLVPTFKVVQDPEPESKPKAKRKVAKKKVAKKATRKVARKATEKVTKKATKKVAKKAKKVAKKAAKTPRQIIAMKAAALRHAPAKLRAAIMSKRAEIAKLNGKVKDCTKQLKALEKQL